MFGPDSRLLPFLLVVVSAGLLLGAVRLRLLPVKLLCGMLTITMAMVAGIAAVNYYYGYYKTWGALWSDFNGGPGDLGTVSTASTANTGSGSIGWVTLDGRLSGYRRRGLVYLPPQYNEAKDADVRFPVVELLHGSPGSPLAWETVLQIAQVANSLLAKHVIGPMVLVMPDIDGAGHDYQDCVNGPNVNDDTYLNQDVRDDIVARYRVSLDPYEWGLSGYSSGGYCAANLALRHRGDFGAAAAIEGYYQAAAGPAGAALGNNQALENANSPLYEAEALTAGSSPLPAFWVAAGTNDGSDYQPAMVFATALQRFEQVPFIRLAAGDTANAWTAALPDALIWTWQQLASPDLRAQFPVRAADGNLVATAPVRPAPHRATVACKPVQPTISLPCRSVPRAKIKFPGVFAAEPDAPLGARGDDFGLVDRVGLEGGHLGRRVHPVEGAPVFRVLNDDHGAARTGEDRPVDTRRIRMRSSPSGHVLLGGYMRDLGDPGDHDISFRGGALTSNHRPAHW